MNGESSLIIGEAFQALNSLKPSQLSYIAMEINQKTYLNAPKINIMMPTDSISCTEDIERIFFLIESVVSQYKRKLYYDLIHKVGAMMIITRDKSLEEPNKNNHIDSIM